ncbi:hypothetical protein ACSBR2_003432 [Camellia fascicularis]
MSIMRSRSRLSSSSSQAPPPSPIPTGKGSRCAADSIFSNYLNRSLKIPQLSLPDYVHRSVPAHIDLHSLLSKDTGSVNRLLRSAADFGVFRISGHGIRVDELRSALAEADLIFQISDHGRSGYCRHYGGCEEFVWRRFEKTVTEQARNEIGAEKYRSLGQKIENVTNKLEAIAVELAQVISETANKHLIHKGIQPRESSLSLYRYDQVGSMGNFPPLFNEKNHETYYEHALSLHLLLEQCVFHVQLERGSLSFNASPDSIVVTVGKQLEEWSLGEFKPTSGELTFDPKDSSAGSPFSIELKCSPANFNHGLAKISKTISLADQILFIIVIALLYKFLVFIFY